MNKKVLKYSLFLLALGLISGFLLGLVNSFTAPVIENRAKEAAAAALREHYEYADYSPSMIEEYPDINPTITDIFYTFGEDGKLTSVIYKTQARGFQSEVLAYVEIKEDGTFGKTVVLEHRETAGIGDAIEDHDFGVADSSVNSYKPVICSGATGSSNAVIEGINAAAEHFKTIQSKLGGITNE